MYPILLQFGDIVIANFGIFLTIAYFAFIIGVTKFADSRHVHPGFFLKHVAVFTIFSYLGVKLLFWILNFPRLFQDVSNDIADNWYIGVIKLLFNMDEFYVWGAVILFGLAFYYFAKKEKEPILVWYDIFISSISISLFFGFIGAFLGGYYVGSETTSIFGVSFANSDIRYSLAAQIASSVSVHPIQLYFAVISLLIFFICLKMMKKVQVPGLVGVIGTILLSLSTIIIEFFRSPSDRIFFIGTFTINQVFALLCVLGSVYLFMKKLPRIGSEE